MAIQDTILTGELKIANLVLANITALQAGALSVNWKNIIKGNRGVLAVSNLYSIGDTSSSTFKTAYACLQGFVGQYGSGTIDPNAQNPGTVINQNNTYVGSNVVYGKIEFTNQTTVSLLNYNNTLKQIYGNDLIELTLFTGGYTQDEQTAPTITYLTPNDPTTDIVSIVWATNPAPVSGYITIAGVMPVTGTSGSVGGGSVPFTFNQADLLQDGNGAWYLPLSLPVNKNPFFTTVNGVQLSDTNYDRSFSPARLYTFANNSTAVIIVFVI